MKSSVLGIVRRTAVPVVAAVAALGLAGTASAASAVIDPAPIGANQFFTGSVNGTAVNAVIKTDCGGPVTGVAVGHPAADQYVAVSAGVSTSANVDTGFTGSLGDEVTAYLEVPSATGAVATVLIGTLQDYVVHLAIPTGITVPCAGAADVAFVPGPPSSTTKTAVVKVTLVPSVATG